MTELLRKQKWVDKYNHNYTMNIYTGCSYGCIYCYSTKPCKWNDYGRKIQLRTQPVPKKNVARILDKELRKLEDIQDEEKHLQIGNAYDVYPIIEKDKEITRNCLKVLTKYPYWYFNLETKSDLILRDIDIIKKIPNFQAEITITTLTHDKYFEPNVPSTKRRLKVIKELSDNGIYVRAMIMPVLGKFTDLPKMFEIVRKNGAKDIKTKELRYFKLQDLEKKSNTSKPDIANNINIQEWVWNYYNLGFSIFPVKFKSKAPMQGVTWKKYQKKRPTKLQIVNWLRAGMFGNIAVICGNVSDNLVCFDFDDPHLIKKMNVDIDGYILSGAWVVETQKNNGRYHIYFRSKKPVDFTRKNVNGVDIRGNDHYAVLPPSIHPCGKPYNILNTSNPKELRKPLAIDIEFFINEHIIKKT